MDTCEEWIDCNNRTIKAYLNKSYLPSCPCYYPLHLDYNNKVWDRKQQKHFQWQNIIITNENIQAYKPQAQYCIRSKLYHGTKTLAAQFCCYDDTMRLITRGKSAGTPNLISPEISEELHQKIDISPWVICKGDWTKYVLLYMYTECQKKKKSFMSKSVQYDTFCNTVFTLLGFRTCIFNW